MKIWIGSSLDEETTQGEETIQGRKIYEEIRYIYYLPLIYNVRPGIEHQQQALTGKEPG